MKIENSGVYLLDGALVEIVGYGLYVISIELGSIQ